MSIKYEFYCNQSHSATSLLKNGVMFMAEKSLTSESTAISLAMTTTFKYMIHQESETMNTKTN